MKFSIPVYVEELGGQQDGPLRSFHVKPLFHGGMGRRGPVLSRVMARFTSDLRRSLKTEAGEFDHRRLVTWTFAPDYEEEILELHLSIKKGSLRRKFLVVWYELEGERYAMIPEVEGAVFEYSRHDDLRKRCSEVLEEIHRRCEADEEPCFWADPAFTIANTWTTSVDINLEIPTSPRARSEQDLFSLFGMDEEMSGDMELESVGHCLTELYPDGLNRTFGRKREVVRVTNLLEHGGNRPVLIIGQSLSGKTALVHEVTWRIAEDRRRRSREQERIWHLSPQRLISGMSYVGQWESRLMAILKESSKRRHVLYFDDLPGLFQAGQTADSQLSVADVLRSWMEKREVRVLGEITPEAWRKLRERDRRFADLFDVVHLPPASDEETVAIIVSVQRELESRNRCEFHPQGLPLILRLLKQYSADTAFPGKAVRFMNQLALRNSGKSIGVSEVLEHFSSQTGMDMDILDMRIRLARKDVESRMKSMIAGQEKAVSAMVDIVMMVKSRLTDPSRPVATMLFLGPTGVGKTESAKALARVLFQNRDRLIRFDMNEFLDPGSAQRMIGTPFREEGLLTRKVRQQPFSVVLFDEIEKADPEIFDLLLAVLGEGRLTDAMGRTVSFANTVIIMTSNLGVKQAHSRAGYGSEAPEQVELAYLSAARQFFKPEFFNRLDHVIPFRSLSMEESERVARIHLQQLAGRFGLQERRCFLYYHPDAMALLTRLGFHPQYGGRALKRVIEKQIAGRLAILLAAEPLHQPLYISVSADGGEFRIESKALDFAGRHFPALEVVQNRRIVRQLEEDAVAFLQHCRQRMAVLAPRDLQLANQSSRSQLDYLLILEQNHRVTEGFDAIRDIMEQGNRKPLAPVNSPTFASRSDSDRRWAAGSQRKLRDKGLLADMMEDISEGNTAVPADTQVVSWLVEASFLHLMLEDSRNDSCRLKISWNARQCDDLKPLAAFLNEWKNAMGSLYRTEEVVPAPETGSDSDRSDIRSIEINLDGPGCRTIASFEAGFWMIERMSGERALVEVSVTQGPVADDSSVGDERPASSAGHVLRVLREDGTGEDFRSGMAITPEVSAMRVRQMILSPIQVPASLFSDGESEDNHGD